MTRSEQGRGRQPSHGAILMGSAMGTDFTAGDAGRWMRGAGVSALAALLLLGACVDRERVLGPPVLDEGSAPVIVSNPVVGGAAAGGAASLGVSFHASVQADVAYVSLPPGTIANGELATIHNARTGGTVRTAMSDGGFDPVAVAAVPGDALEIVVQVSGAGVPVRFALDVPERRAPLVVRTDPPPQKVDVPLNVPVVVVFSEPVDAGTVTAASVRVERTGVPVPGRLTVTPDGLRAEFRADQLFAPNTVYVLTVTRAVADLSGEVLEQTATAEFTTGTTQAVATVAAYPAALFVAGNVNNGTMRTKEFSAILHDDGRITGDFKTFNPAFDVRASGRITCFSIVDGRAAWLGGVIDEIVGGTGRTTAGMEVVWRAVDHGAVPDSGVDQISYDIAITQEVSGTAQEYCDNTPPGPTPENQHHMNDVASGDIVVTGSAPPQGGVPLRRFSGGASVGIVNASLAEPFRVFVIDAAGNSVAGVPIEWAVTGGGGSIAPVSDVTSHAHGVGYPISSAVRTLGPGEGVHTATATAPTLPGAPQVTFTATAVTAMVEVRDSQDGGFVPSQVTVPPRKSVAWIYASRDFALHDVSFEDDPTQPVSSAALWLPRMYHVRTFGTTPATIRYRCTYHSTSFTDGEVGTVVVQP